MKYSTPELVVLGSASALVLGPISGGNDNPVPNTQPLSGVVLGLDE